MDEFLLLFRSRCQPNRALLPAQLLRWQGWLGQLKATGSFVALPSLFDDTGRTLAQSQPVADGPYWEGEAAIDGLLLIKAVDYESASQVAKGCPLLAVGGSIEVRRAL